MKRNSLHKRKYLFIIPRMGVGGAERVMATLANEFSDRNNDVMILSLTTNESSYDLDDNVKIIGAGYKINSNKKIIRNINMLVNGIRSLFYIHNLIDKWNPDIVISFLTHTNILSLITKMFHPELKLIVSERCEPRVRRLHMRLITKYFYPLANIIVCQSEMVAKFFSTYTQKKIKIIQNPINLDSISNEKVIVRKKIIVGVGRLFEQKNFSLLINSFSDIRDEFPEHVLEIYGEGHLREQLQKQIDELDLNNRVFLMGIKSNVMKYVYDSELFVISSNYEGFPNALIEAMASGMPVISTDFSTGVARDLVKKENGIVVPVGDRKRMSQAMRDILSNKDYQKTISEENRKIKDLLSPKTIVNKWSQVIDEIL